MIKESTTVEVRMYNVGFGDAFLLTVRDGDDVWRMQIDCGKHSQSQGSAPIAETVGRIVNDLRDDCAEGRPHLDVVVATHRHKDHVSGFACEDWKTVSVGEVWLPFVEDAADPVAANLRQRQERAGTRLQGLIDSRRTFTLAGSRESAQLDEAAAFTNNSGSNQKAMDRLLGLRGTGFANRPLVRYLPSATDDDNVININRCGVTAHILGPPRTEEMLKKMKPPASAGWLRLDLDGDDSSAENNVARTSLFDPHFTVDETSIAAEQLGAQQGLDLDGLTSVAGLLSAASVVERAVNNTSLFFVLDVSGFRMLFPGDAQYGAWLHVQDNPHARELINSVSFYKVGHHGSHNATPPDFVAVDWNTAGDAMLPWSLVQQWSDTIPAQRLVDSLIDNGHSVITPSADSQMGLNPSTRGKLTRTPHWVELSFTVEN